MNIFLGRKSTESPGNILHKWQRTQETIQKLNEKPKVSTQGQYYSKVTLLTKTFPTILIMWSLVGGNPVFWGDKEEATKWKISIIGLYPVKYIKEFLMKNKKIEIFQQNALKNKFQTAILDR
jgi:hypothetical protein